MQRSDFQRSKDGGLPRMILASVGSLAALFIYLFVFRWSERCLDVQGDYLVTATLVLLGATMIATQPAGVSRRAFFLIAHFALSAAVFSYWRLPCRPGLSDPIW
jgi:hypothetical protein